MSLTALATNPIARASQQALSALSTKSEDVPGIPDNEDFGRTSHKYSDELERFKIWLREHDAETGALDHRLRESAQLRDRVLGLLVELAGIVSGAPQPDANTAADQYDQSNAASAQTSDAQVLVSQLQIRDDLSVRSTSLSLDTNATLPDSLSDSPRNHIHDVITHLFELGPSILDPAPHNRLEGSSFPEATQHDISHVRDSFPKAADNLVERLGRANWERRQYLVRLRSTATTVLLDENTPKLFEDNEDTQFAMSDAASDSESSAQPTSHAGELAVQAFSSVQGSSLTHDTSASASRLDTSEFQFSRGEVTMTNITAPSIINIHVDNATALERRYRVPLPPSPNENLSGGTFLCPFCAHMTAGIKSPLEWRKHIFADLEPYVCTYPECMSSAKTYRCRRSWWLHEKERHRTKRAWVCTPCTAEGRDSSFETPAAFDQHITTNHTVKLTSTQLAAIRDACHRDIGRERPSSICPLCQITISGGERHTPGSLERAVKKHVSDHLEQLALFVALPAGSSMAKGEGSDFQDDSDSGDGLQSEIMSIVSRGTRVSKKDMQLANVKAFIADQQRAANDHGNVPMVYSESPTQRNYVMPDVSKRPDLNRDHSNFTPSFPILGPMPPPSEHFYSRDALLSAVDSALSSPGSICVIHGVGGVGKTLAAVQYSHNTKQDYDAIFWLQADTAPGLADSYVQMVAALGISGGADDHHQVIAKGRNWLQDTDKRWLLVFDNAYCWDDISRYFPKAVPTTRGSVIVTTHHENIIYEAPHVTKVRIDPLDQRAGSEMLLKYLGRDVHDDPERQLAREISAFVGGLPVAIAHVAGYVSFSRYTLEEMIETFREWRKRTGVATDERDDLPATFREASFSYDGTLAMVWEVTLRELTQDACDVLYILAFLNCAAVPQKMLWGIHEDPLLHFLDSRERIRMRRINESLIKRRLVDDADSCFSMHRSLQRGIRQKLSQDRSMQQRVFNQAVAVVREAFPRSSALQQPRPEKWSELQKLLPHLHALRDVYRASKSQIKGSVDFAQLLLDAGMDQFEQGIAQEGLLLLNTSETVLDASSEISPDVHRVMKADIHALMGIMYDDIGIEKRREALGRRELALGIRKTIFKEAKQQQRKYEILLFNSWMEYAISLLHYHRYEEANPVIESCLAKFKEWGPEDEIPFEYAKYYNKIALVRMYQGKFSEAIELASKGVQLMEKTGYNMFASRFKFDLACITLQSGDLDRALQMHKEIHDHRIKLVGPTNQLSLHSMYAIGAIYELKGDLHGAEYWFRQVLDQPRSFSSWPDEAYARAQYHLGQVLLAQGRDEDVEHANNIQEKARQVLRRLLPLDMPPELEDVTDEAILFDHMLPVSPGGPRFTGRGLLERFLRKTPTT